MKMGLRLSTLTHQFKRNDVVAFYNSLSMKPVFVEKSVALLLEDFFKSSVEKELFLRKYGSEIRNLEKLLDLLEEYKILVGEEVSEQEVIRWHGDFHTGNPYVSIMYLILTDQCNFGCNYCFVEKKFQQGHLPEIMSPNTVDEALETFSRCAKMKPEHFEEEKTIICYGGEPLINLSALKHLLEKVDQMKSAGDLPKSTVVSMVSNGTLVTKEVAQLLNRHNVAVAISIDGDQQSNNSCRTYKNGNPTFDDAVRGLKICQEEGVDVGISCTLNMESIKNFEGTISIIVDEFKVKNLGFNIILSGEKYPVGEKYDLEATQKIIQAFECFRSLGIQEDRMLRKVEFFVKGKVYPFDCGASGGGQIVVAPNGKIGICHGYLGSGKYFSAHVSDCTFNPAEDNVFREWSKRSPLNMPQCFECEALGICGGGCPMYADDLRGSIWELDKRFCVHAKTILEWLIWDLFRQQSQAVGQS